MKITNTFILMLWSDDKGASAVEYAILISCIAAVIVTGVTMLGQAVVPLFHVNFPH